MNADRLHALLRTLKIDFQRTGLRESLDELSGSLHRASGQPNPAHQNAVGDALQRVYASLTNSKIDQLSPAWIEMLREIGAHEVVGSPLRAKLEDIFSRTQITLTIARDEVDPLNQQLSRISEGVDQGLAAFEKLSIGADDLSPNECELGFMIPRLVIHERLDEFSDECKEFDIIFGTFSEVATGQRQRYKIKTISSSDLSIFLECPLSVAALIAIAGERILAVYKQMLEIKKLRNELRAQNVPLQALKAIDEEQNSRMDSTIEELTVEIITEYYVMDDPGRKNELENALRISLNKLANRIDRGFHIEVRVGALPEKAIDERTDLEREQVQSIQKASEVLQFIKLGGEPMLNLPENNDVAVTATKQKHRKT